MVQAIRYVRMVGGSALVVAGLGILAICWIRVTERAGEVGLRRAPGATKRDIFAQFLMEAVALSTLGGAIGSMLSVAAFLASPSYPASSALALAGYVCAAVIVLNTMFACLPAYRAANMDPIRCLRPS